jgi:hypothetical protein
MIKSMLGAGNKKGNYSDTAIKNRQDVFAALRCLADIDMQTVSVSSYLFIYHFTIKLNSPADASSLVPSVTSNLT